MHALKKFNYYNFIIFGEGWVVSTRALDWSQNKLNIQEDLSFQDFKALIKYLQVFK